MRQAGSGTAYVPTTTLVDSLGIRSNILQHAKALPGPAVKVKFSIGMGPADFYCTDGPQDMGTCPSEVAWVPALWPCLTPTVWGPLLLVAALLSSSTPLPGGWCPSSHSGSRCPGPGLAHGQATQGG